MSTVLYKAYSRAGALLYVGMSCQIGERIKTHSGGSFWFKDVAKITLTHFPNAEECRSAEKKSIRLDAPKYNIQETEKEIERKDRLRIQRKLKRDLDKFAAARKAKA